MGSEPFQPGNLLDRVTRPSTLEAYYAHMLARERLIASRRLGLSRGDVLSVGCGWHPGRHLFPSPPRDRAGSVFAARHSNALFATVTRKILSGRWRWLVPSF